MINDYRILDMLDTYTNLIFSNEKQKNENPKNIFLSFDEQNFEKFSTEQKIDACKKLHFYICKLLNCKSAHVYFVHDIMSSAYMSSYINSQNNVNINIFEKLDFVKNEKLFGRIETDQIALCYLFSIIHETMHIAQYANFQKFLKGEKFDKNFAFETLFSKLKNLETSLEYTDDLCELSANLKTLKIIQTLIEKGLIKNTDQNQSLLKDMKAFFMKEHNLNCSYIEKDFYNYMQIIEALDDKKCKDFCKLALENLSPSNYVKNLKKNLKILDTKKDSYAF